MNAVEHKALVWLVLAISLAFAWVLWPFYSAILWGTVIAVVFAPLHRRLLRSVRQRNVAALAAVVMILFLIILPLALITASVLQEAYGVYESINSGEINASRYFHEVRDAMPEWASGILDRLGLSDLGAMQERLFTNIAKGGQFFASQAINIGGSAADFIVNLFIMLYLLFFLLRDGDELLRHIKDSLPLHANQQRALFSKFTTVIRATVKGSVVVAFVQGSLGGVMFWFLGIRPALLWAALMTLLALLPVIGTGRCGCQRPPQRMDRTARLVRRASSTYGDPK
jgi:predicted PurR-regulated permease PerM